MPAPDCVMTCSMRAPSLVARNEWRRQKSIDDCAIVSPCTDWSSADAFSSRSIFSSSETAKGSSSIGVSQKVSTGCSSAKTTGARSRGRDERAISTARPAMRSISFASMSAVPAKPQAPSTKTRTPMPASDPRLTPSTRPFSTSIDSESSAR